jgi:hypothetical protein
VGINVCLADRDVQRALPQASNGENKDCVWDCLAALEVNDAAVVLGLDVGHGADLQ